MTKEQILLTIAGALISLGLFVIVTAIGRAKRRAQAIERVDALLTLMAEPATSEIDAEPDDPNDPFDRPFREQPVTAVRQVEPIPAPRPATTPAPRPPRTATGLRFVVTLSDTSGSFGVDSRR